MNIKFAKVFDVKTPNRNNSDLNVGVDFYMPAYSREFMVQLSEKNSNNDVKCFLARLDDKDLRMYIEIGPHSQVNIPSGIRVILPTDRCLNAFNKSGIATKYGLLVGAQLIDPNYRGQIHINLHNNTDKVVRLEEGQKIAQFAELEFYTDPWEEIEVDQYEAEPMPDDRGTRGFGEGTGSF